MAAFLTGFHRADDGDTNILLDISEVQKEGVLLTASDSLKSLGVCILAGSIDLLQTKQFPTLTLESSKSLQMRQLISEDLPVFFGVAQLLT